MRNLEPLPDSPMAFFDKIVRSKKAARSNRLKKIRQSIQNAVTDYEKRRGSLESLTPIGLDDNQKADMVHCYETSTVPLVQMTARMREYLAATNPRESQVCQYCCISTSPRTLDHYAPKDFFPEFSVLPANLVPCCADCNSLKKSKWMEGGCRRVLSIYFDQIPHTKFLYAAISVVSGIPRVRFFLSKRPSDFSGLECVIRNHFEQLGLLQRYAEASASSIAEQHRWLHILFSAGVSVEPLLTSFISGLIKDFSPNYWKVALLEAMVRSRSFLAFCRSTPGP